MPVDKYLVFRNRRYYMDRLRIVMCALEPVKGSVLDLGCGEMFLHGLLPAGTDYLGVDEEFFSKDACFVQADVSDFLNHISESRDYIFCLGVLDHMPAGSTASLIRQMAGKARRWIVLSRANRKNPFLGFARHMDSETPDGFVLHSEIFLLKIPLLQRAWALPSNALGRRLATEVVQVWSGKNVQVDSK